MLQLVALKVLKKKKKQVYIHIFHSRQYRFVPHYKWAGMHSINFSANYHVQGANKNRFLGSLRLDSNLCHCIKPSNVTKINILVL